MGDPIRYEVTHPERRYLIHSERGARVMSRTWELRNGKVLVVEDASTASLVIVARDLKDRDDKIAVLEEILRKLRT
jgi:hypothetical protein